MSELAQAVKTKRGNMNLRAAAREIGVSPTTVSKMEAGGVPDQATLAKVCLWLGSAPEKYTALGNLNIETRGRAGPFTCKPEAIIAAHERFKNSRAVGHE